MVNINSQTDSELLLEVANDNTAAFEQLYDRYSSLLYSLIKKIVTDKNVAEKILYDVFVIVWKRIDDFDYETDNVYTWIVLLARKKAIDVLKRRRSNTMLPKYDDEFERFNILPNLSKKIKILKNLSKNFLRLLIPDQSFTKCHRLKSLKSVLANMKRLMVCFLIRELSGGLWVELKR